MDDTTREPRTRTYEEWTPTYRVQHHFIGLILAMVELIRTLDLSPKRATRNVTPDSEEQAA